MDTHTHRPVFTSRHYVVIAEVLRSQYMTHASISFAPYRQMNRQIEEIALEFAIKFKEDNPIFNPVKFLDACSPDPERFPFSELWDEEEYAKTD